ncbi:Probable O-methyltransferase 3 [Linum perenne]
MDRLPTQKSTSKDELFKAQSHIYNGILNYINSMALKSAVDLEIPDIIHNHNKPITIPELISSLNIHPSKSTHLHRLMRILTHSGFFQQVDGVTGVSYSLTPSSQLLVKTNPNCLSPFVTSLLHPDFVTPWHVLGDWFTDDGDEGCLKTAFEKGNGVAFWEYNEQNPEFNSLFNEAMACDSRMMNLVVGDCGLVFQGVQSFVDVGGGNGTFAKIVKQAYPGIDCRVLELPQVVGDLAGCSDEGVEFVAGDMFQHVPFADAVLLKLIMHGWKDEECVKILKKCKEAIQSKGKVMIIDIVINEKKEEHELSGTKLLFDMLMMLVVNGRERTEKEWEKLFLEAGFSNYKITPLFGLRSLIEVFP